MPLVLLLLAVAVLCSMSDDEPRKKRAKHGTKLEKPAGVSSDSGGPDLGKQQHPPSGGGSGSVPAVDPALETNLSFKGK
jgi:hypothetical protein